MSNSNTPPNTPANTPAQSLSTAPINREIKLISHSNLFYWWPVWLFGLLFAFLTLIERDRLAVVPNDAVVTYSQEGKKTEYEVKYTEYKKFNSESDSEKATIDGYKAFPARISNKAWMGSIYVIILLLTITITNVPLRGLLSFMVIILVIVLALLITLFNAWDTIFNLLGGLKIYINLAGYLVISVSVLIMWVLATMFFDRRAYIIFTPGQVKVCEHIGDSVRTYDTVGMTFEKQRDDLFRHYILGFGSGDLIVRTAGAERQEIKIHNVLGIGWNLEKIENMIRERATVSG